MKKHILAFILLSIVFSSCNIDTAKEDYSKYVDPLVGTGGHGHTFPGATTPFGLVQLSPDTGVEGWDWCSGYHYSDSSIIGFSHTHLSGTGGADYGDILLMPTVGEVKYYPGTKSDPDSGYRSRFSHDKEIARVGYYAVILEDYGIKAELTASPRTGLHKYTFPKSKQSNIILDLKHGISDRVKSSELNVVSRSKIEGLRQSQGWAGDQKVYFAMEFSKPFLTYDVAKNEISQGEVKQVNGTNIKAAFRFATKENEVIMVKVGISAVSTANAWENLETENPKIFNFDKIQLKAKKLWTKELNKFEIEDSNTENKRKFYTAVYHTKIHPNIYQDSNNQYRGMDDEIHMATKHENYTLYSLWDTFRALHPLYSLTDKEKNNEFIKSMLVKYKQYGKLPVWELWNNETNTMIGYHSIPVIADAIMKNYGDFDPEEALEAMLTSANDDGQGLKYYKELGYIPRELEANSVSKTLEYAFDDYCIAMVAKKLGKDDIYKQFIKRSMNYKNLFNKEVGFMVGRDVYGRWNEEFDPMAISLFGSGDFTEGNSWHYSFFAPHDMQGLIELYGGNDAFSGKLDQLFEQEAVNDNEHAHDVTGLLGQYAQGNEPSHHVIFLYNFVRKPHKTQEITRRILKEMYSDNPDGYSGNEDTGQMSAWYVFTSMGFYPMNPLGGQYIIASPLFERVKIKLENGKTFEIKSIGNSDKNIYIQSVKLNGEVYSKSYLDHESIENGGVMEFTMGPKPSLWATSAEDSPKNHFTIDENDIIDENITCFMPYSKSEQRIFKNKIQVELESQTEDAKIYYSLNGDEVTENSILYDGPIILNKSQIIKAKAFKEGYKSSKISELNFKKAYFKNANDKYPSIILDSKLGQSYNPGVETLIDGKLGSNNFRDGRWTGVQGDDFRATIDLGDSKKLQKLSFNYVQNTGSWIFPPKGVKIYTSNDGKSFKLYSEHDYKQAEQHLDITIKTLSLPLKTKSRFVKLIIENFKSLPTWHPGSGSPSYVFVDEITIE
jgi:predicted alpha-1,2-mannosidase